MIVALLENISERILSGNNSNTNVNPGIRSVKADLEYKKDLIQKSVSTLEEAKAQYEALQVKVDRLDNLEETLKKEIKTYKEKTLKANKDIVDKYSTTKPINKLKAMFKTLITHPIYFSFWLWFFVYSRFLVKKNPVPQKTSCFGLFFFVP